MYEIYITIRSHFKIKHSYTTGMICITDTNIRKDFIQRLHTYIIYKQATFIFKIESSRATRLVTRKYAITRHLTLLAGRMVEEVPARPRPSRGPLTFLLYRQLFSNVVTIREKTGMNLYSTHSLGFSGHYLYVPNPPRQNIFQPVRKAYPKAFYDYTSNITPVTYWQNRTFTCANKAKKKGRRDGVFILTQIHMFVRLCVHSRHANGDAVVMETRKPVSLPV